MQRNPIVRCRETHLHQKCEYRILRADGMAIPDAVILTLSIFGLLISLYFTLVYYRLIRPDTTLIPKVCRLDEATCQYLMGTRNARILGVRNFVLGLLYYIGLILYVGYPSIQQTVPLHPVVGISLLTVLVGVYLVYGLIAKLKTHCVLCYASHAINFIVFLALGAKAL